MTYPTKQGKKNSVKLGNLFNLADHSKIFRKRKKKLGKTR